MRKKPHISISARFIVRGLALVIDFLWGRIKTNISSIQIQCWAVSKSSEVEKKHCCIGLKTTGLI